MMHGIIHTWTEMLNNHLVQPPPYDQIWLSSFYCLIVFLFLFLWYWEWTPGPEPRDRIFSTVFYYGVSPLVLFVVFKLETRSHYTAQASSSKYFQRPTSFPLSAKAVGIINVKWLRQGYRATRLLLHGSILYLKSPWSLACNQKTFKVHDNLLRSLVPESTVLIKIN